jgi:hypothetical protein
MPPLGIWTALYYILPIGAGNGTVNANFRLVSYTTDVDIPHDWVLICMRNGDYNYVYFPNGIVLAAGQSSFNGLQSSTNVVNSVVKRDINGNFAANEISGSKFTDEGNTAYFLDPASTSDSGSTIRGGILHGPNTTWGKYLMVGGDGRQTYLNSATTASIVTTNGNLHIDAASDYDTYINYYDGTNLFVGAGDSSGSPRLQVFGSANYTQASGNLRAPLFYDSVNNSYYVDPDSTSNINSLVVNGGGTYYAANYFRNSAGPGAYLGSLNNPPLQAYSADNGPAFMSFHRGGQYAVNMGLDPDNVFRIGGWSASANRLQLNMSGDLTIAGSLTAGGTYVYTGSDTNYYLSAHSTSRLYAIRSDYFADTGGAHFFKMGQTSGTTRHLNLSSSSGDPSQAGSDCGISWGIRGDSNPYYMIMVRSENWNSSGNYTKLEFNWHTGIRIGASPSYGGTRFFNNSPGISGVSEIFSVGRGDSNVRVENVLYAGSFYDIAETSYYVDPNAAQGANLKYSALINGVGSDVGYGLAFYPSWTGSGTTVPTYGMMFAGTATYGTHGSVSNATDWAMYFTMNNSANRGWIFRDVSSAVNVASISNTGYARFASLGVGTNASGTAGEIRATDNVTAYYSDERLKTRLGKIENPIEKVKSLSGFYFAPNDTAMALGYQKKIDVGVSAQEVKEILPEIIAPAPIDPQYMTVRYEKLIPLLIEAIKAQQSQIEELQKKISELQPNK